MSLSGCSKLREKSSLLYHVLNHVPALAWYVNELIDLFGFSPFFSLMFNEDMELRGSSRQEIALYFHNGKEAKIQAQCLDSAVSGQCSTTAFILVREKHFPLPL